jgi:alpha-L-rhamnosidase
MLTIKRMTVEYLDDPVGIDEAPQFGWEIESGGRGVVQRSYRLQIARDADFGAVEYDSGIVRSGESAHVRAKTLKLDSTTKYWARVRISDGTEESGWCSPACFTTALLGAHLWRADFVSAETKEDEPLSKGTYVRHTFLAGREISQAFVCVTALGLYNLYINGKRVARDELTPGWTSYKKHLTYQTYDVTRFLRPGGNAVGAMLGAGWYKSPMGASKKARNFYGSRTALLCQIEILYRDGSRETVKTDESWRGHDAPVLFAEIYDGETYDARLEIDGWCEAGFDDSAWRPVRAVEFDKSALKAQAGGKVRQAERFPGGKFIVTPQGDRVIDFGQNMAGWVTFRVKGRPGERVTLKHFEILDKDGNVYLANLRRAKQTVTYTLKGGEEETFRPHFTYYGFRYVKVAEYPGEVRPENFEAVALHSDMRRAGSFECSDPDVNQLHHNILWGLKSNFVDVPTDCPQRDERLGWVGDAQIFCRTACYLMDAYTFFSKWLADVKADQTAEGGIPHVVPDILPARAEGSWLLSQGVDSAAAWADAAVIVPWTLYLMYGDKRILEKQYDSMKGWVDYMRSHAQGAIWSSGQLQFGDWVALDAEEGSYFGATPTDLICSAFYAYSSGLFAKAAQVLGREADYQEYRLLHESVVKGFRETFFKPDGNLTARTQTAQIVALHFDLVPDEHRENVVNTLLELLKEHDGHLVTGFVGTPYFCHALSRGGRTQEAYDLLQKDDFPSWLYQVKAGATTVWEHWDGVKPDGTMWSPNMNSFNHYAYGAVGEWLYKAVAGVDTDEREPGYKHSVVCPRIGNGLDYVKARYASVYGDIRVAWEKRGGGRVALDVAIPPNTSSTIVLDGAVRVAEASGLEFARKEGGFAAEAGSGIYHIEYDRG